MQRKTKKKSIHIKHHLHTSNHSFTRRKKSKQNHTTIKKHSHSHTHTHSFKHNKTQKRKNISKTKDPYMFTEKDFNSGEGFMTSIWGPPIWHFLHTLSFNYPVEPTKEQKKQYRDFVLSLEFILPCKYCRINLKKNFHTLPLTMEHMMNRMTFSHYLYDLHELINKMLGKSSGLTYEDVRQRYEHFRARGCDSSSKQKQKKINNHKEKEKEKEKDKGCTHPLHGKKAKCVLNIVPHNTKCETFHSTFE